MLRGGGVWKGGGVEGRGGDKGVWKESSEHHLVSTLLSSWDALMRVFSRLHPSVPLLPANSSTWGRTPAGRRGEENGEGGGHIAAAAQANTAVNGSATMTQCCNSVV